MDIRISITQILQLPLVLMVAIGCLGCGDASRVKTYPVAGEAKFNGQPITGAHIHLHPLKAEALPPAFATVNQEGKFQLTTYAANDGAAAGDYAVTVSWSDERRTDEETFVGPDKLRDRFSRPDRSGLKATINAGTNEPLKLDLK